MKKLAISIITYNRAKHIKEDLEVIAQPTKEQDIDIYIFDGSTNEQTRHVIEQYKKRGYGHIQYFHSDKSLPSVESIVQRMTSAFYLPDAEYVWLCGDKFTIMPKYYSAILSYIQKGYDIITIYGRILHGTRTFSLASSFVEYAIVPITHFGSTIIKKELMADYNLQAEREKLRSFWVQSIYLKTIANKAKFKGVVIDAKEQYKIKSKYDSPSSSLSCMWLTWIVHWNRFIDLLPSAYDSVREGLYNRPDLQLGFFSLKELLRQRSEGQFDCKKYWEYREYVKKVIVMPHVYVFCISLLPKNFAKWLWSNYDYGKRICSWAKSGVKLIGEKL